MANNDFCHKIILNKTIMSCCRVVRIYAYSPLSQVPLWYNLGASFCSFTHCSYLPNKRRKDNRRAMAQMIIVPLPSPFIKFYWHPLIMKIFLTTLLLSSSEMLQVLLKRMHGPVEMLVFRIVIIILSLKTVIGIWEDYNHYCSVISKNSQEEWIRNNPF